MQIADGMVTRAAKAMYARKVSLYDNVYYTPWESLSTRERNGWQQLARACLETTNVVATNHLCDTCLQSKCWTRRDIEHACEDSQFPARAVVVECGAYVADKRVEEVLQGERA